jgi:diguanylate cyclase
MRAKAVEKKDHAPSSTDSAGAREKMVASREETVEAREVVVESREASASLREDAILAREEEFHVRENSAQGRETIAFQREETVTGREQESHDDLAWRMAQQEDRNAKLTLANEQLVIASLQLQVATEEIEKSRLEMTHLAHHDFLTNLPNRVQLDDRLAHSIAWAKRHHARLAVLFLDLDRFKGINDSMGHGVGDQVLQAVAQRLRSAIRATDTATRRGGDEFVLVLSEVCQEPALALKIEKLRKCIAAPYSIAGHDLKIGVTIGISTYPDDGDDGETLIRNADAAMYHAKESGRNRIQFFRPEMRARIAERKDVEVDLYQALDKGQFVLFYQAQVDFVSGAVTGAEALIRWHHPTRGWLLPAWFIPIAEDCGAIVPIGRWVLREACRQAQAWLDEGLALEVIAVNISAREFEDDGFLENVRSVLREVGLAPERLELELTETVLMKSIERAAATLRTLRAMGVRISIDDFGTGYSSLSYLKRFPFDTLKIDQSFVRDIGTGEGDILVNAIIGIGNDLHHHVIAEGVETPQQLAFLHENRCAAVQGFYLHVPMMAAEFANFLKQGVVANILPNPALSATALETARRRLQ